MNAAADSCPEANANRFRREVAAALRRARGKLSQPEFCALLEPWLGRVPDPSQWSKYERGKVDPPAYLLVAAARAVDRPISNLFEEPQPTLQHVVDRLEQIEQALREAAHEPAPTPG